MEQRSLTPVDSCYIDHVKPEGRQWQLHTELVKQVTIERKTETLRCAFPNIHFTSSDLGCQPAVSFIIDHARPKLEAFSAFRECHCQRAMKPPG